MALLENLLAVAKLMLRDGETPPKAETPTVGLLISPSAEPEPTPARLTLGFCHTAHIAVWQRPHRISASTGVVHQHPPVDGIMLGLDSAGKAAFLPDARRAVGDRKVPTRLVFVAPEELTLLGGSTGEEPAQLWADFWGMVGY